MGHHRFELLFHQDFILYRGKAFLQLEKPDLSVKQRNQKINVTNANIDYLEPVFFTDEELQLICIFYLWE